MAETQVPDVTGGEQVAAPKGAGGEWTRKYPPLVTVLVALILAIAVLPSALNLPQTNPTQTLEYAPVPPEESDDPPPAGNLSSLGLGSSSGVAEDAEGGEGPGGTLPPLPGGQGVNPSTKRCVGNPPRQTEDPTSPPCVAYFDGDNFGATYQGVTKDEVRVLIYISGNVIHSSSSKRERSPQGEYFDLLDPPKDDEFLAVKGFRGWQRYFNDRFQTYGRLVHFFIFFDDCGSGCSPESRRAHAADNYARVKPFAVLTDVAFGGNEVDYVSEMARRGVLNFGTLTGKSETFFRRFPKLVWGFDPTIEYQARTFSNYVCQKVVGKPAVRAGNSSSGNMQNRPRKLGLLHTTDENHEDRIKLAELVQQQVEACGGEIAATATFPTCCYTTDTGTNPDYASTNMAEFSSEGITTILWPGGMESNTGAAASTAGYQPEWIVLGDDLLDGNGPNQMARNGPAFDDRAFLVTPEIYDPERAQQRCYQAYREADRELPEPDLAYVCEYYRNLFQLFTGIQVAGPRLGPTSIDKGYHAIPAVSSKDNQSPACFYNPGDYTCVKDVQIEIWDDQSTPPDEDRNGCWRIISNASRYLPDEFPAGNVDSNLNELGPCNNYSTSSPFVTGVPT
ncbi:MAG TPA: hypothetical protein VMY88_01365 [Acidimicrobiales bacterium]|nr:hypothetical protein [Acidimicrobiales bacterium]